MQFQVQQMVKKQMRTEQEQDNLDLFVGLHSPLTDPFNIFMRVEDIENDETLIYFYGYSIGKKKIVLWGVYNIESNEFLIDDACRYKPNELKNMIDTWKDNQYQFYFSGVKDRISTRMNQELMYDNRRTQLDLIKRFKKIYTEKLIHDGIIPGNKQLFDKDEYINVMRAVGQSGLKAVKKYQPTISVILSEIDNPDIKNHIEYALNTKNFSDLTPYEMNVANHILIYLFLMLFFEMDDYRVAKYILYLKDKKIKNYLKSMFMYEWLYDLGKILRVYNTEKFMIKMASDIIRLTEPQINRSDLGVIGGPKIPETIMPLIQKISKYFEKYITKSKFTKTSFVNNIKLCPTLQSCSVDDKEGCELYIHGKTQSKHDLR